MDGDDRAVAPRRALRFRRRRWICSRLPPCGFHCEADGWRRTGRGKHCDSERRFFAARLSGASQGKQSRACPDRRTRDIRRSEEHTSELQSLMRISYAVFCLKKKKHNTTITI